MQVLDLNLQLSYRQLPIGIFARLSREKSACFEDRLWILAEDELENGAKNKRIAFEICDEKVIFSLERTGSESDNRPQEIF